MDEWVGGKGRRIMVRGADVLDRKKIERKSESVVHN